MVRRLIFLIVLLLSLGVGLFFGWVIKPGVQVGSPLSSLREDFRTDYILMVAEVYNKDGDLTSAAGRLEDLNSKSPTEAALLSVAYARKSGYSVNDIDLLMALARDMQTLMPVSAELSK
jgi:hypothetical protein